MPTPSEKFKQKGNAAFSESKYAEAIQYYTDAISGNANCAVFFCNRSLCYSKLLRWVECKQDALRALSIEPASTKALCRLIEAGLGVNDLVECKKYLVRFKKVNPVDKHFRKVSSFCLCFDDGIKNNNISC
jgi:tetratricopeptide (TPR) repeat protein